MADLSAAARAPALNQDNNAAAPEAADAAPAAGVAAAVDAAHNHQNGGGDGAVAPAAAPNRAGAAPVPAARPRRGGISNGRVSGRRNYSRDELERLMTSVRAVLPISGADWESIEATHSSFFPDRERTWEQLKKKFWGCANKNMPTGDPNIPWHVQEAKEIRRLIIERTEGTRGSPSEGFFDFSRDDPEDDDSVAESGAIAAVHGGEVARGDGGGAAAIAAVQAGGGIVDSNNIPPPLLPRFGVPNSSSRADRLNNMLSRIHAADDNDDDPDLQDHHQASRRRANPTPITRRNQQRAVV